jgi:hypothetical protein
MPRLLCQLCPLASKGALVLAAQANPMKARRYLQAEQRIGHSFTDKTSMAEIIALAQSPAAVPPANAWTGVAGSPRS